MEFINVPASQVQPVSGYVAPPSIQRVKQEVEEFFFKKGMIAYKIYKNAYASSLGNSASEEAFIFEFFNALENSVKAQLKTTGGIEPTAAIKDIFNIMRSSFSVLSHSGIKIDPITFYATLVAFVLSKLK